MKEKTVPKVKASGKKVNLWVLAGLIFLSAALIAGTVHFAHKLATNSNTGMSKVPGTSDYIDGYSNPFFLMLAVGVLCLPAPIVINLIILQFKNVSLVPGIIIGIIMFLFLPPAFTITKDGGTQIENALFVNVEEGLTVEESIQKELLMDAKSEDKEVYLIQKSDGRTYYKHLGTGEEALTTIQEGNKQ